jgi:hypothetical protein
MIVGVYGGRAPRRDSGNKAGTPFGEFTSQRGGVPKEAKIESFEIASLGCNRGVA